MLAQGSEVGLSSEAILPPPPPVDVALPYSGAAQTPEGQAEEEWTVLRRCRDEDPNIFYLSRAGSIKAAKAMCAECVVREPCLDASLVDATEEPRVLGGHTLRERLRIQRQRILELHR